MILGGGDVLMAAETGSGKTGVCINEIENSPLLALNESLFVNIFFTVIQY